MNKVARKIHRWVSYLVFIQVTLWIAGGLTFAILPFDSIVKGGSVIAPAANPEFPKNWTELIRAKQGALGAITGVSSSDSSQGLLLQLRGKEGESVWVRVVDGEKARPSDSGSIARYAQQLYAGDGSLVSTRYLAEPEYRYFGFVDELYGRVDVWQASFSDSLGSRLYFDGETGRYLTVRNDFWVFYDAMWRLHIMDYRTGEDFNNKLLLLFAVFSFVFAISGLILTITAIQRALRRART